ncbi:aspartyl protease family protein [Vigna unguiculata]|uniref:Aspartyl protease family protein n=1 Tax=Vigna unguiculata TaxID=3917 RepID=A0A4D6MI76_VIGUN|nr:aspartyl protease family protein [Vigna unguiculata]
MFMAIGLLLWLLLAKGLSSEGSVGVTFSSRLVHRFSKEAKIHLASRGNGSALQSWPERNSSEYLRLLLRSDVTRQRMRLGSQYETLYPSEGGETFSFGNVLYWLHYAWIDIGTPNVSFLVALDAGSDMLWVPCDCIECASLSAGNYNVLDRDLNLYTPSLSNTSRHLPCGHKLCDQQSFCKGSKDPCPYSVQYATDNTTSSGILFEDKLHLASDGRHTEQNSVQASIILGCGRKQTGEYLEGASPDGVLGLGPGNISVPSLLAKAGLTQNSFSICLGENESGRIIFGDQGHATQHSTPFLPINGEFAAYMVGAESFCVGNLCLKETRFQLLIDSGSSFTFLPNEVYQKVVMEFDKQVNATRIILSESEWDYCYNVSSQELINVPPLKLVFSRNQTLLFQNPIFTAFASQEQDYTVFCLPISPTDNDYATIGQNYLMGYRMVFDRENLRFGWSRWNCQDKASLTSPFNGGSPNPLPANQQQSVPNARAVPPAIAGHASAKRSAATAGLISKHSVVSMLLICHLWLWSYC